MGRPADDDCPLFTSVEYGERINGAIMLPEVRKYVLKFLLDEAYRYASLVVVGGGLDQPSTTTPSKLVGFNQQGVFGGITADVGNDQFIIHRTGHYLTGFTANFNSNQNNIVYNFALAVNGVVTSEMAPVHFPVKNDPEAAVSTSGMLRLVEGDTVSIYKNVDSGSTTFTLEDCNFWIKMMASQEWTDL